MTVGFFTLGCKVNQYETQAMREQLEAAGYIPVSSDTAADIFVVNSCSVTAESDRKARQLCRRLRRDYPGAILVLCGCSSQAYPDAAATLPVDVVLGNACRTDVLPAIEEFLKTRTQVVRVPEHTRTYEPLCITDFDERTRAFVKIEDGCDRFCSYCIIPTSRGRIRSRDLDSLKTELAALAKKGFREVVLTGINLTAFGKESGLDLADAVAVANAVPGIERVRLGSLEPEDMTPQLIEKLKASEKLCPQFHLSLQSGCDATLKRMRRRYDTALYATICDNLRAAFPSCAITTDIMVGFPGETEEEFAASLAFAEKIGFARAHVFAYSKREGTVAAKAPDQISAAEKNHRSHQMSAVCRKTGEAFLTAQIGQTATLLTEQNDGTFTEGYTENYTPVKVRGVYPQNELLAVRLTAVESGVCRGEIL